MDKQRTSQIIREFYDTEGWTLTEQGHTLDAELNEDLRNVASDYVKKCRLRLLRYLPQEGTHLLDMASGPLQYPEYLTYSKNFQTRHCVDLSQRALDQAKEKIGDHGRFYCDDFLNLHFEKNFFDATICCHTLYHIHKDQQAETVHKLLDVTKTNKPVIIVYNNPNLLAGKLVHLMKRIKKQNSAKKNQDSFYFFNHPISFWDQFKHRATIEIYPWRSFSARHQKAFIPDNFLGRCFFYCLFKLEDFFPRFFIHTFKFHTVVLKKFDKEIV